MTKYDVVNLYIEIYRSCYWTLTCEIKATTQALNKLSSVTHGVNEVWVMTTMQVPKGNGIRLNSLLGPALPHSTTTHEHRYVCTNQYVHYAGGELWLERQVTIQRKKLIRKQCHERYGKLNKSVYKNKQTNKNKTNKRNSMLFDVAMEPAVLTCQTKIIGNNTVAWEFSTHWAHIHTHRTHTHTPHTCSS